MVSLSVIVPIYNTSKYLSKCLDSIVNQTLHDMEIICVNDGSTDNSLDILHKYAENDCRIKIINKENGGHVSARKAGLRIANSRYVTFVDSDDWLELSAFSHLYSIMERKKVACVMCGHYVDDGTASRKVSHGFAAGIYDKDKLRKVVYPRMIMNSEFFEWGINPSLWAKLYDSTLLKKIMFNENERIVIGEDAAVVFPFMLEAKNIYICQEYLYHYRQNLTSIMKTNFDGNAERDMFEALYSYSQNAFHQNNEIKEQWVNYLLFLMVQRADTLYDGIDRLPYLFPFPKVRRGANILLYGASTYGQRLYHWLNKTKFCNVVGWYDRNAVEFIKQGLPVLLPENISEQCELDIVIAVTIANTRKAIFDDLRRKYPDKYLHTIDVNLILSKETRRAFRLD